MTDHYATLGLQPGATKEEIRRAYRVLASKWHPDRCGDADAHDRMAAIQVAYDVLYDDARREHYDQTGMDAMTAVETQARQMIMQAFFQEADKRAWQPAKYVQMIRQRLTTELGNLKSMANDNRVRMSRIDSMLPKGGTSEDDLFRGAGDSARAQFTKNIDGCEEQIEKLSLALEILAPYKDNVPMDEVMQGITFSPGTIFTNVGGSGTGGW